jgi:hypothetical protein
VKKLREIYKRNIYGVMGTLIFHILLFSAFLLAEVEMKGTVQEEELLIEFPEELISEPELLEEDELPEQGEPMPNDPSSQLSQTQSNRTNIASKQIMESEDFFDEDYTREVEAARQLSQNVRNQLSNITYYLENRYHLSLPIPVYLAQGGGKVIVDIAVNRQGRVVQAEPQINPAIRDEQIFLYAKAAASRTVFNADPQAPELQRGTIHYILIAH